MNHAKWLVVGVKQAAIVLMIMTVLLPTLFVSTVSAGGPANCDSISNPTVRQACQTCQLSGRVFIIGPNTCVAGPGTEFGEPCDPGGGGLLGFPTWYQFLGGETDSTGRCQPVVDLRNPTHIAAIGIAVLDILLRLAGILSVIFVIVGGFKFILSQGNPENAKGARNTIINALVGVAITTVATALVTFLGNAIGDS